MPYPLRSSKSRMGNSNAKSQMVTRRMAAMQSQGRNGSTSASETTDLQNSTTPAVLDNATGDHSTAMPNARNASAATGRSASAATPANDSEEIIDLVNDRTPKPRAAEAFDVDEDVPPLELLDSDDDSADGAARTRVTADSRGKKRARRIAPNAGRARTNAGSGNGASGDESVIVISETTSDDNDIVYLGTEHMPPDWKKKKRSVEGNVPDASTPAADSMASASGTKSQLQLQCPICLDDFQNIKLEPSRRITATSCGHLFCSRCIGDVISQKGGCPNCRKKLTPNSVRTIFM